MIRFTHVLCPIDHSESSLRALDYAVAIARRSNARLTVLHVVPTFDPVTSRPAAIGAPVTLVQTPSREDVLDRIRTVAAEAGAAADEVAAAAEAGDPVAVIVDQVLARHADLLVLGTHGRSGFDRMLLGSVTEKLLRKAPCPVLTVPPHASKMAASAGGFLRVLCPMDFSPAAQQAFGFAAGLVRPGDGRMTLLHAIEWLSEHEPRTTAHFNVEEYRGYLIQDAHERLRAFVAESGAASGQVIDVVSVGRAHPEIVRRSADHDLIVMGAQGRGGLGLSLFGSTTQQVVRGASCPVLTVRAVETP
jgi:nucleotide-binding universal stress UspA family protein